MKVIKNLDLPTIIHSMMEQGQSMLMVQSVDLEKNTMRAEVTLDASRHVVFTLAIVRVSREAVKCDRPHGLPTPEQLKVFQDHFGQEFTEKLFRRIDQNKDHATDFQNVAYCFDSDLIEQQCADWEYNVKGYWSNESKGEIRRLLKEKLNITFHHEIA